MISDKYSMISMISTKEIECKGLCGSIIIADNLSTVVSAICDNSKDGWCCECRFSSYTKRWCEFCTMVYKEALEELTEEEYDNVHGFGAYKEMKYKAFEKGLFRSLIK